MTADRAALDLASMAPLGDRVLVRPKEAEKKSAGGIILATTTSSESRAETQLGEVVAVGGKVTKPVQVGDTVLFGRRGTSDVELAEGKVVFVVEASILATLS